MKLISTAEVESTLENVRPTHIAVAFVGLDWKRYIDINVIEEMIVSPTIGTNPYAIQEIVNHIGWDKIHFLTNLHTKLYIGSNSAVFWRFNLFIKEWNFSRRT